jgi:leader peptidase (prepilin peptidase) / N-methyltransferase
MRRAVATGAAIGGGLALLAAGLRTGADGTESARIVILGIALGAVAAADLAEHRIPNRIVVPAAVACAALLVAEGAHVEHLLGGLAVVALMLGLSLVWPMSFGMGDIKLALLLVLGLGGVAAQALVLGLILGAAFGVVLVLGQGRLAARRSLPMAPFLGAAAAVVVLL